MPSAPLACHRHQTITVGTWDSTNPQVVPEITGYEPGWLPGALHGLWPCCDQGKLDASGAAWRAAQRSLTAVKDRLHSALTALVDNNHGPDLDELNEFWSEFTDRQYAIFTAMDNAFDAVATGLGAYGQTIDTFDGQLRDAIIAAALEAGAEGVLAIVCDVLSDGGATVLTGPEGAAIAARAAGHLIPVIQRLLDALRAAANIQDIDFDGRYALSTAIQAMPAPDLATQDAWQTGDDIQPANNPTPRGSFDETEAAIAAMVRRDGHVVLPVHEPHDVGRTPDALVDGQPVEFKTMDPTSPATTIKNILNKTQAKDGQAPELVLNASNTRPPITADAVNTQLRRFFAGVPSISNGIVKRVTVLMPDGTKTTWPSDYAGL